MEIYEALYTTRAMRRVKPDPIPFEAQARILDAAVRAPSGGNTQTWRFLLVDDTDVKSRLGPLYHTSIDQLWKTIYADRLAAARANPDTADSVELLKNSEVSAMACGQFRASTALSTRLCPTRLERRLDLPRSVERPARCEGRRDWLGADKYSRCHARGGGS